MKIELSEGDELVVTLAGTDGEFRILFDFKGDNKVRVLANMPDDKGRGGDYGTDDSGYLCKPGIPPCDPEIYCEDFGAYERDKEGNLISQDIDCSDCDKQAPDFDCYQHCPSIER